MQSIPHWFVGKLLFFFEYDLELAGDKQQGSFYAIVEVMKAHKTASQSKSIPLIQPFSETESKKYAVLDVADIISTVGLIQKTKISNKKIETSNWFYVISPSTAFHKDMSVNAGKINELL